MHRKGEDARFVLEDFCGAVALMHVEVDDQRALDLSFFQEERRGYGDIVEDAKA